MSFFGGGGGVQEKLYTITTSDALHSVPVQQNGVKLFSVLLLTDSAFVGAVDVQFEDQGGVWHSVTTINFASGQTEADPSFVGASPEYFIPLNVRVYISTALTAGTCKVFLHYM